MRAKRRPWPCPRWHRAFAAILCGPLLGCLAEDPGSRLDEADRSIETSSGQKTTAPMSLDPAIHADRAFSEAPMLAERVKADATCPLSPNGSPTTRSSLSRWKRSVATAARYVAP